MKKAGEIVEVEPAIKPLGQTGAYGIGRLPAVDFRTADTLKRWVQAMRKAGVGPSTEAKSWKVLQANAATVSHRGHCRPYAVISAATAPQTGT